MIECSAGTDVVGGLLDGVGEYCIAGQTKDEIGAVFFAPRHHLRAAVMPVAADRDVVAGQCRRMRARPAQSISSSAGTPARNARR
jgi:hypothetical protein